MAWACRVEFEVHVGPQKIATVWALAITGPPWLIRFWPPPPGLAFPSPASLSALLTVQLVDPLGGGERGKRQEHQDRKQLLHESISSMGLAHEWFS